MSGNIEWPSGLLRLPTGQWLRQVPTKHSWGSTTWCSQDGEVYRRYFNAVTGEWHWNVDGASKLAMEESTGAMGIHLESGFTPLATVIALAWLHRAPNAELRVEVQEGTACELRYIRWAHGETNEEEADVLPGEKWKALRHWKVAGIAPVPDGYEISTNGRLKSPDGAITRGFWFKGACGPTRLAGVKGVGLVDLWLVAKLIPAAVDLKPCIGSAFDAMMMGKTPQQLSSELAIKIDTAWSYTRQAAMYAPKSKIRELGETLVSRDLWRLLVTMREEGDDQLGDRLTTLMERVKDELSETGAFARREWPMGELAFARQCTVALT